MIAIVWVLAAVSVSTCFALWMQYARIRRLEERVGTIEGVNQNWRSVVNRWFRREAERKVKS